MADDPTKKDGEPEPSEAGKQEPEDSKDAKGTKDADAVEEFEKWLASQDEDTRTAFESHTSGLTSALDRLKADKKKLKEQVAALETGDTKALRKKLAEYEKAQEKALEANKEFEALWNSSKDKLADIEPKLTAATEKLATTEAALAEHEKVVSGLVTEELEAMKLDENIIALLEGKTATEKLEWLRKYRASLPAGTNVPKTPAGNNQKPVSDEERRAGSVKSADLYRR